MITEIHVQVSFKNRTLIKKDLGVVQGDYNTTKLVFHFEENISEYEIVFKMSDPQGNLVLLKALENNEIILVGYTEEGEACTLFNEAGIYPFELALYEPDGRLTSAPGWLTVSKCQVVVGDEIVEAYIPFFDELLREVGEIKSYSNSVFANSIPIEKSGETINLTDISSVEHTVGVKLASKNVVNFPQTMEITGDGKTAELYNDLKRKKCQKQPYKVSWQYKKSENVTASEEGNLVILHIVYEDGYSVNYSLVKTTEITPEIQLTTDVHGDILYVRIQKHLRWQTGTVTIYNLQIEKGTVTTGYSPYIEDVSTVEIKTAGKNLIDVGYQCNMVTGYQEAGLTFTVNEDNSITVNGTAQYECYPTIAYYTQEAGKTYTLSGTSNGARETYHLYTTYKRETGTSMYPDTATNDKVTFTAGQNYRSTVRLKVMNRVTMDNVTIYPQVEIGKEKTEYERYCGATYTPNTDGTVEGVKSISPVMNIYPNTVGVLTEAQYNADTKKYIDNKFAELQAAIVSTGGNV